MTDRVIVCPDCKQSNCYERTRDGVSELYCPDCAAVFGEGNLADPHRLYDARVLAGLSLGQAAKVLGTTRRELSDLEWGRRPANPGELERLAEAYDVRLAWLRGETRTEAELMREYGPAYVPLTGEDREKFFRSMDAIAD